MGPSLVLLGIVLLASGVLVSISFAKRAEAQFGPSYAYTPGTGAVPKWASLVYLLGLASAVVGLVAWLAG